MWIDHGKKLQISHKFSYFWLAFESYCYCSSTAYPEINGFVQKFVIFFRDQLLY